MASVFAHTVRPAMLAASRADRLRRTVERSPVIRKVVRRFVPGDTLDGVLDIVATLRASGRYVSIDYLGENVTDADEGEAMRDFASQGYKIVMGHSGRFVSAMEQVAPKFPNTQFIAVSGNEGQAPNVMSIDWNNAQFGCQLGVLAAHMSKTHKVAGVYGLEGVPNITAQAGGFRICATKAGAAVTILYVKDMEDAAAAKEAGLSLIAQGADVLTGKLNAAEAGLVEAANEKHVYVTGRGFDQTKIAPDLVLTNILEDWPAMFGNTADQVKDGKLFGTFVQYGYDTPPVTGGTLMYEEGKPFNPIVPAAVVTELQDMAKKFASGEMKVAPTREDARGGS